VFLFRIGTVKNSKNFFLVEGPDAGLVDKQHLERAIKIAAEEIEARKAVGDY